jgi:serine/threonine protein kinase
MELADGGTLLNRILNGEFQSRYKEEDVARWVTLRARWVTLRARWVTLRARWVTFRVALSVLRTLAQCHAKHVIYRDIKPENFVYKSAEFDSKLKAIDFGLAVYHPPGSAPLMVRV